MLQITPHTHYLQFYAIDTTTKRSCPYFVCGVSAGFPSPAADYVQKALDLNDLLIHHPASTFFVRVHGQSMIDAGLQNGDLLIVDRSLNAKHKDVVLAIINGDFTVKRLLKSRNGIILKPENPAYEPITITADMDFEIWGVVTNVIHKVR